MVALFAFLLLFGVACFVLAMLGVARVNWIALGLALCFAVPMIQAWQRLLP